MQPPGELLQHWGITPIEAMGSGRRNQHWLVTRGQSRFVLRASKTALGYELELLRRLKRLDWPVAEAVQEPVVLDGITWALFTHLPGKPAQAGPEEQRIRGRLLAALHESTAQLDEPMGQRPGWDFAEATVFDSDLGNAIKAYERIRPAEGVILRRYCDWARAQLTQIEQRPERIVIHGDFARWNLLFEDDRLSGLLDFEFSHLDYRVSDFALSWRGNQDEVLAGYQDVRQLTEVDKALLEPTYIAWILEGMTRHIGDILSGSAEPHGFDWQVKHLLRVQLTA
jgi:aminoglycoside phosphotransferase (APT) family kinase protein